MGEGEGEGEGEGKGEGEGESVVRVSDRARARVRVRIRIRVRVWKHKWVRKIYFSCVSAAQSISLYFDPNSYRIPVVFVIRLHPKQKLAHYYKRPILDKKSITLTQTFTS